jgi:hypothetical protein
METKGDNIYVNIKELPQLDEVQPGDLLIVETDTGTNVIDFSNFVLPPENVTFYGEIVQLQTEVEALSTIVDTTTTNLYLTAAALNAALAETKADTTTQIQAFSSTYIDNFITGVISFNGLDTESTTGVNCTSYRNAVGNYSVVFNGPIKGATVSSNADKTRLDGVQGNVCLFTTMSAYTTMSAASAIVGEVIYVPADATFISVIGA